MDTDERVKMLETEFQTTRDELRQILMDIRTYIMEVQSPFQNDSGSRVASAQTESEKEVAPNGNG